MVSTTALHAEKGPGFVPQMEPWTIPRVCQVTRVCWRVPGPRGAGPFRCEHVGGDALPSEIQFLRGDGNIHRSGVEVESGGGRIKVACGRRSNVTCISCKILSLQNEHYLPFSVS